MKLSDYDFDKLKTRFPSMSDSEVLQEYVSVSNSIWEASVSYGSGSLDWDSFSSLLTGFLEARDYLAGYLAGLYLEAQGYSFSDDGRWLPCGT